jgi:hypothetical protein
MNAVDMVHVHLENVFVTLDGVGKDVISRKELRALIIVTSKVYVTTTGNATVTLDLAAEIARRQCHAQRDARFMVSASTAAAFVNLDILV